MNEAPGGQSLAIKDSTNQTIAFMGQQLSFDDAEFAKGIEWIDQGLQLFPERLDMWFGKVYAYGEKEAWDAFTQTIKEVVALSGKNGNQWKWKEGAEHQMNGKEFLLEIQSYQLQLYRSGHKDAFGNMRQIAEEVLVHYPEHIPSMSNIAISYMVVDELDKALTYLKKAEKLDPKDVIVRLLYTSDAADD